MPKNMGTIDKTIRVVLALAIIGALYAKHLHGTIGIIAGVVAIIFLLTSLIGFCPIYWPFGISTKKKSEGCGCGSSKGCC